MRRHVQQVPTLLCLLGACTGLQTEDPPATVQFDLVFPPNYSLIEPYYPSPVIFAVHNFSAIGQNTFFWSWNITVAINTVKGYESTTVVASGQSRPDTIGVEMSPDVLLIIEPVSQLWNNTMDLLRLSYTFGLTYACGNTTGLSTNGSDNTVQFKGESFFAILPNYSDEDNDFIGGGMSDSFKLRVVFYASLSSLHNVAGYLNFPHTFFHAGSDHTVYNISRIFFDILLDWNRYNAPMSLSGFEEQRRDVRVYKPDKTFFNEVYFNKEILLELAED
ncbi:uncharacterized protein J4E92_010274 [Alternaria infectoria]|uniref:uncharacterized protein n=1 Tax=Alternaria infectoria TaxID=45303 RepID=UPI002221052F|nr:uncharacterized protein J4E92_010274 [Alternaria infectoria]KAI4911461.1 hypothetical protein J4E92_010274 [Alternaria infectoria]